MSDSFFDWIITQKHYRGMHDQKRHAGAFDHPDNVYVTEVFDAFKKKNAPKDIIGIDWQGEEIWGYTAEAYTSDYMIKSDETRKLVRWAYRLSDGRVVSGDGAMRITNPDAWERLQNVSIGKRKSLIWTYLPEEAKLETVKSIDWNSIITDYNKDVFSSGTQSGNKVGQSYHMAGDMGQKIYKYIVDNDHPMKVTMPASSIDNNLILNNRLLQYPLKIEAVARSLGKSPLELTGDDYAMVTAGQAGKSKYSSFDGTSHYDSQKKSFYHIIGRLAADKYFPSERLTPEIKRFAISAIESELKSPAILNSAKNPELLLRKEYLLDRKDELLRELGLI